MVRQGEVDGSIGWTKIKVVAGGRRRIVLVVGHHRRRNGNGLTNSTAGCGRSYAPVMVAWFRGMVTCSMNKKAEGRGEEEKE